MGEDQVPFDIDLSLCSMTWLVDRLAKSWAEIVGDLREKIEESKTQEEDYIYHELRNEVKRLVVRGEKPDEASFKMHGVVIKKKIVHRKSEKYNGADLYLEVEGVKFALIQCKVGQSRYTFDNKELRNLERFCELCVNDPNRPISCPVFIWLIKDNGPDLDPKHRILKVCQVRGVLGSRSSARVQEFDNQGITRDNFKELLAKCWEGAPFVRKPSDTQLLNYSETLNRILIEYNISTP